MQLRFVKVVNSVPQPTLYDLDEVIRLIWKERNLMYTAPHSSSPRQLYIDIFSPMGYFLVKEIEEPHQFSKEQLYYCERTPVAYALTLVNTCDVTFRYVFQPYLVKYAWEEIRNTRNQLLSAADWVLNSKEVTQLTKLKYAAYIKILRDITDIYEYPQQVILPSPPHIEYLPKYAKADYRRVLTEDEVATLKDNKLSMDFYKLWESTNFNLDFEYVKSLYTLNSKSTTDVFPIS